MLNEYLAKIEKDLNNKKEFSEISDFIESKLDEAALNFFPQEGKWYAYCYKRSNELSKRYIPCHLRDNVWLARMFKKDKNIKLPNKCILRYVRESALFDEKRREYEQRIVTWQIKYMLGGGDGWLLPKGFDEMAPYLKDYDKCFRDGIVITLSAIGIDRDAIEEGIEKNANLWRDKIIYGAYLNEFFGIFSDNLEIDEEHKAKWIKLRNYEYYIEHKESVDKYGSFNNDMLISEEEAKELKEYLGKSEKVKKIKN